MIVEISSLEGGAILSAKLSGPLDPAKWLATMSEMATSEQGRASKGYLVDVSECDLSHLSAADIQDLSVQRNELRALAKDTRPSAIVAPDSLAFGLSQIGAAYDASAIYVTRTHEDAVAWLRERFEDAAD